MKLQAASRRAVPAFAPALALAAALAACAQPALAPGQRFPVFFTVGTAAPDAAGQTVIAHAADWARDYAAERVTVTGYADPDQPAPDVARLALRRAQAVARALRQDGIDPARITVRVGPVKDISGLYDRRVDIAIAPL